MPKKAVAKKPVKRSTKTSPAKKRPVAKKVETSTKPVGITKDNREFFELRFTIQSFYWLIIGAMVLALAGWVLYQQIQITQIYDQIDANLSSQDVVTPSKKTHTKATTTKSQN